MLITLALFVASCGSYQQSSYYDNDGIYSDSAPRTVERRPQQNINTQRNSESDTYSDYFGEKANQYDEILDSEIFTDVDSYATNENSGNVQQGQLTDYYSNENDYQGYGGWGDNATNVSINIYDNGWNNWGYGGFGFGWNNWGWNNWGYGYGWNNWGYGGFGYGWNNPWRWNRWNNWGYGGFGYGGFGFGYAGYGYGWNYPYYNYGYGYGYGNRYYNRNNRYYNQNFALNNSRRGNYIRPTSNSTALRGRSNVNTRGNSPRYRSTDSRATTARSSSNTRTARTYSQNNGTTRRVVGVDQNRAYRTSRSTRATPRYSTSSRSSNTTRRYSTGANSNGTTRSSSRVMVPRTSTYRSSGNNGGAYRSSGNNYSTGRSTRSSSSGSYRSSGSTGRSSSSGNYSSGSRSSRSSGSMRSSSGGSSRSSGSSSGRSSGRRN